MSAPMAAGALALELAQVGGQRNTIVSTYLVARLLGTTVATDNLDGNKSFKKLMGMGRLDIGRFIYGDDSKGNN
jgi:hypothetical protein